MYVGPVIGESNKISLRIQSRNEAVQIIFAVIIFNDKATMMFAATILDYISTLP